jgi:hypothetical protein
MLFPLRKDLDYDELDARRTRLAAILAEKALSKGITQFTKVIQTRQEFYQDFIHGLQKSIRDSKAIATEVELKQSQTKQYTLTYLFDWDKVLKEDNSRLKEFLMHKWNESWLQDALVEKSSDDKKIYINARNDNNFPSISI